MKTILTTIVILSTSLYSYYTIFAEEIISFSSEDITICSETIYYVQAGKIKPIPVNKSNTNTKPEKDPNSEKNKLINRITLSNNNLTIIPLYVYSYINLEYLDLSNNNLTSIPDDIKQLSKLKEIRLSNNKFVNFPQNLLSHPTLEIIDLSHNKILNLNCDLSYLLQVKKLNLSNNSMA